MDIAELAMMLESIDNATPTEEEFQASAGKISSYGWLPDDQKLQFYGLYKQCTVGDVNTKQPWAINMVAKAKWYANWIVMVPSFCLLSRIHTYCYYYYCFYYYYYYYYYTHTLCISLSHTEHSYLHSQLFSHAHTFTHFIHADLIWFIHSTLTHKHYISQPPSHLISNEMVYIFALLTTHTYILIKIYTLSTLSHIHLIFNHLNKTQD
jgi:hypothetical protein